MPYITGGTWTVDTNYLALSHGGTNANLTAINGGIAYSTASALAISVAGTSGQALISGGAGSPTWYAPTAGSVLFAGASGILAQDNSKLFWDDTNYRLGIGTAAPAAALHIGAGSPTGLTTYGDSVFISGELEVGETAYLGPMEFGANSGAISWIDMPVTSSASIGTVESYTAKIDGTDLLTVYAESDGAGGIQNARIGIGTASPTAKLDIAQTIADTGALKGIVYTGAINTNQTLSTEIPSLTLTTAGRQWATGALATQREVLITQPTYSFVGASTITDAATLGIVGAPIAGTNATLTNSHGLLVQAGAVAAGTTNSYGLTVNAQTGATNNYAAAFMGGNVGIGTAAPAYSLDIAGNMGITGATTLAGTSYNKIGPASHEVITVTALTSTAIQAAIDALPAGGGKVFLPEGTYNITATITIPSNVWLEGAGNSSTILRLADGVNVSVIANSDQTNGNSNIKISNLKIDGNDAGNTGADCHGIYFDKATYSEIDSVYVYDAEDYGVYQSSGSYNKMIDNIIESNGTGIYLLSASSNRIINNTIRSNSAGFYFNDSSYNGVVNNVLGANNGNAIYISASSNYNTVISNTINTASQNGISLSGGHNNTVTANNIYNSGDTGAYDGISMANSDNNIISSNRITDTAGTGYAIDIDSNSGNNTLVGNYYSGTGATAINDAGTGTKYTMPNRLTVNANNTDYGAAVTALTVTQSGTGQIVSVADGANSEVFAIADGGQTTFKPTAFDTVYTFDGAAAYADNTAEAKTSGGTAFAILALEASSNDEFYLGLDHPFNTVYFDIATAGAGVTLSAQYYSTAWTALTLTADNTTNLTVDGAVTFTAPTGWTATAINGVTKYWIRLISPATNITAAPAAYSVSPTTGNRFYVYGQSGDTAPALYVNDKGNVGIGTATQGNYKLYANGNVYINGTLTLNTADYGLINSGPNIIYMYDAAGGILIDPSDSYNNLVRIGGGLNIGGGWDNPGNGSLYVTNKIGIGIPTPSGRLHSYISNSAVTTSQYTGYFENLATNTTTDGINKYGAYITSTGAFTGGAGTATNNYGLYVNTPAGADNNYAAVFADGNVGIGAISPSSRLTVNETSTGSIVDFQSSSTSLFALIDEDRLKLESTLAMSIGALNDTLVDDMEVITDWTASSANTPVASETAKVKVNDAAMKITTGASSATSDYVRKTYGSAQDWQTPTRIGFWIQGTQTGQIISLQFYDATVPTTSDYNITIKEANLWQYEEWDISGIASTNRDEVSWVQFIVDSVANTPAFYIDQLRLYTAANRNAEFFIDADGYLSAFSGKGMEFTRSAAGGGVLPSMKIGSASVEISQPLDLQVEGDVGIEYNLALLNNDTSYITSAGPLIISAGDPNSYENLTITTSGTGDIIIDIADSASGLRIVGTGGGIFSVDKSGNVFIGGVNATDSDLTVKRNIATQGGNITVAKLSTPANITVTPVGTAGATTYGYRISAINGNGQTLASATVTTATGNAVLSTTNYNSIVWDAVSGATGYKIYGRTSGAELYMATVNSPSLIYNDDGTVVTPAGALPDSNTTGGDIAGILSFSNATNLTLATDATTITQTYHTVDEEGAAIDNLSTINGGTAGDILVLRGYDTDYAVTAKDGIGNLKLTADFIFTATQDTLVLMFDGTNWLEISHSTNGADIAESYYTADLSIEAGDVAAISSTNGVEKIEDKPNYFIEKTSKAYDAGIIGVISTNPFITMGGGYGKITGEKGNIKAETRSVALAGRAPVKVNLENGNIEIGDFLTSSSVSGVAMKAAGSGRVVGRALEPFDGNATECGVEIVKMETENKTTEIENGKEPETLRIVSCQKVPSEVGKVMAFIELGWQSGENSGGSADKEWLEINGWCVSVDENGEWKKVKKTATTCEESAENVSVQPEPAPAPIPVPASGPISEPTPAPTETPLAAPQPEAGPPLEETPTPEPELQTNPNDQIPNPNQNPPKDPPAGGPAGQANPNDQTLISTPEPAPTPAAPEPSPEPTATQTPMPEPSLLPQVLNF